MAVHRVILLMDDDYPISLGSILMTQGVIRYKIDSWEALSEKEQKELQLGMAEKLERNEKPLLLKRNGNQKKEPYRDPSGKTIITIVQEYFEANPDKKIRWSEAKMALMKNGPYGRSSINNAIINLVRRKILIKPTIGIYMLNPKRKPSLSLQKLIEDQ